MIWWADSTKPLWKKNYGVKFGIFFVKSFSFVVPVFFPHIPYYFFSKNKQINQICVNSMLLRRGDFFTQHNFQTFYTCTVYNITGTKKGKIPPPIFEKKNYRGEIFIKISPFFKISSPFFHHLFHPSKKTIINTSKLKKTNKKSKKKLSIFIISPT